jgi:uncharacterized protein with gpF-like domain
MRNKYIQQGARAVGRYIAQVRKDSAKAISEAVTPEQALQNAMEAASNTRLVTLTIVEIWYVTGFAFFKATQKAIKTKKYAGYASEEDFWRAYVNSFVTRNFLQKVKGIDDTTVQAIQVYLTAGIEQGWGIEKMAKAMLSDKIPNLNKARALRIARTEVTAASNAGSIQGAKSSGVAGLKKKWIVAIDDRARQSHLDVWFETNTNPIPLDDFFNVGGSQMQFPGDPLGAPAQVINCRCAVGYVTPLFG